ncbi:hypothetical protein ONZ45_g8833 [Pleurotus djamor]|nr:hypothetical protein ONZ45_g8833 [Pleurotus djamor]
MSSTIQTPTPAQSPSPLRRKIRSLPGRWRTALVQSRLFQHIQHAVHLRTRVVFQPHNLERTNTIVISREQPIAIPGPNSDVEEVSSPHPKMVDLSATNKRFAMLIDPMTFAWPSEVTEQTSDVRSVMGVRTSWSGEAELALSGVESFLRTSCTDETEVNVGGRCCPAPLLSDLTSAY